MPDPKERAKRLGQLPAKVVEAELARMTERRTAAGVGDDQPSLGIALSGGGIRAATISLGALQAMMERGLMRYVDYLSSVSGGGYIASCLIACWSRRPPAFVPGPGSREQDPFLDPEVVGHLRTHGSYLIPHSGVLGRDFLRAIGAALFSVLWSLLFFGGCMLFVAASLQAFLNLLGTHALIDDISRGGMAFKEIAPAALAVSLLATPAHFGIGALAALATLSLVWGVNSYLRRTSLRAVVGDRLEVETDLLKTYALGFYAGLLGLMAWRRVFGGPGAMEDALHGLLIPLRYGLGWVATALVFFFLTSFLSSFGFFSRLGGPMRRAFAVRSLRESLVGVSVFLVGSTALLLVVVIAWSTVPSLKTVAIAGLGILVSRAWTMLSKLKWENLPPPIRAAVTAVAPGILLGTTLLAGLVAALTLSDRLLHWQGLERVAAFCTTQEADEDVKAIVASGLICLGVALLGYLINLNILSPHHFYRDRLADTFLTVPWPRTQDRPKSDPRDARLKDLLGSSAKATSSEEQPRPQPQPTPEPVGEVTAQGAAPYPIINCALNLSGSSELKWRNRKSDLFVFTPKYCGSAVTGYVPTEKFRGGSTSLATAMAVSGAAANSGMGYLTSPVLAFFVTLFNLRLGYWIRNPLFHAVEDWVGTTRRPTQPASGPAHGAGEGFVFWPKWVIQEAFAKVSGDDKLINVSDGGHTGDNLGVYSLLQRRLRMVIAIDASCDPGHGFQDLMASLHQIEVDEGVVVDIRLEELTLGKTSGKVRRQFAIGRITYPEDKLGDLQDVPDRDQAPNEKAEGWLIYIKSSLRGDEPENATYYKVDHPAFPHQSTGDQFFDDHQFEAYRALGKHLVLGMFDAAKATVSTLWEGGHEETSSANLLKFARSYFYLSRSPKKAVGAVRPAAKAPTRT